MAFTILLLLAGVFGSSLGQSCHSGQYWDSKDTVCRECTPCPPGHHVMQPCSVNRDTVCTYTRRRSKFFFSERSLEAIRGKRNHICPVGQYFDMQTENCTKCSECSEGQFVLKPCGIRRDTICVKTRQGVYVRRRQNMLARKQKMTTEDITNVGHVTTPDAQLDITDFKSGGFTGATDARIMTSQEDDVQTDTVTSSNDDNVKTATDVYVWQQIKWKQQKHEAKPVVPRWRWRVDSDQHPRITGRRMWRPLVIKVHSKPASTTADTILIGSGSSTSSDRGWQEVTYGLMGALGAVSLVLICYIVISCVRARSAKHSPDCRYHALFRPVGNPPQSTADAKAYWQNLQHIEKQLAQNIARRLLLQRTSPGRNADQNDYAEDGFYYTLKPVTEGHVTSSSALSSAQLRVEIDNAGTPRHSIVIA